MIWKSWDLHVVQDFRRVQMLNCKMRIVVKLWGEQTLYFFDRVNTVVFRVFLAQLLFDDTDDEIIDLIYGIIACREDSSIIEVGRIDVRVRIIESGKDVVEKFLFWPNADVWW